MELPPSLSPLPSKSWYSDNAGVEEVIGAGTVGVVKVLEDMRVNSCFNLVLDIIHRCSGSGRTQTDRYDYDRYDRYDLLSVPKRGKAAAQILLNNLIPGQLFENAVSSA